jgi:hypothetical protein
MNEKPPILLLLKTKYLNVKPVLPEEVPPELELLGLIAKLQVTKEKEFINLVITTITRFM